MAAITVLAIRIVDRFPDEVGTLWTSFIYFESDEEEGDKLPSNFELNPDHLGQS